MGEVAYAAGFIEWLAEEAKRSYGLSIPSSSSNKRLMTVKQPIGVAGMITPVSSAPALKFFYITLVLVVIAYVTLFFKAVVYVLLVTLFLLDLFFEIAFPFFRAKGK